MNLALRNFIVLFVLLVVQLPLFSGEFGPQLSKPSNLGQEFYFTFIPCYEEAGNNRLMVYIAAVANGTATVEVVDKGYKESFVLKANDVVPVSLGPGNGQAFSKPTNGGIPPEQVYPGAAIHITSDVPCIVYGVTRFAYTSDSFLALPVEALGNKYICASMSDMTWMYGGYSLPSEMAIVATENNTHVHFTLGGPAITRSGGGMKPGDTKDFTMNAGDVWVVGNDANSKEGDMTGSIISADKPVAVLSGNQCANVPVDKPWCDFITEQLLPMEQWGKHYLVPRYESRTYGYYERVFAGTSNCPISLNGQAWRQLNAVGGQENSGWLFSRIDPTNSVFSLTSTSPISVTVYNPGQSDDNVSTDPFQLNVMPWEQFGTSYIFCTPGTKGGINFTRNFCGVVFPMNPDSTVPADLEFGISTNGKIQWQSLASKFGPGVSAKNIYVERMPDGLLYGYKECILSASGVYALRGVKPFGVYLYGGSDYDSYGNPAGAFALDLSKAADRDAPGSTLVRSSAGYTGTTTDYPSNPAIRSNMAKVVLEDANKKFTLKVQPFSGGTAETVHWTLVPNNMRDTATAKVTTVDRAGNSASTIIKYIPVPQPAIASTDTVVCGGDTITVRIANENEFSKLLWSTGDTSRVLRLVSLQEKTIQLSVRGITALNDTSDLQSIRLVFHFQPTKPRVNRELNKLVVDTTFKGYNSYQWFGIDGKAIPGATNPYFEVTGNSGDTTKVYVVAANINGCSAQSELIIAAPIVSDVEVEIAKNIRLNPNPATTSCTLSYGDTKPRTVEVFDARGVLIQSFQSSQLPDMALSIALQSMSNGVYTVQLNYNGWTKRLQLIKN